MRLIEIVKIPTEKMIFTEFEIFVNYMMLLTTIDDNNVGDLFRPGVFQVFIHKNSEIRRHRIMSPKFSTSPVTNIHHQYELGPVVAYSKQ